MGTGVNSRLAQIDAASNRLPNAFQTPYQERRPVYEHGEVGARKALRKCPSLSANDVKPIPADPHLSEYSQLIRKEN
jgi:hypothetical protein